jgi:hypothetical protein
MESIPWGRVEKTSPNLWGWSIEVKRTTRWARVQKKGESRVTNKTSPPSSTIISSPWEKGRESEEVVEVCNE